MTDYDESLDVLQKAGKFLRDKGFKDIAEKVFTAVDDLEHAFQRMTFKPCPPHSWNMSGEKCIKCGGKDWMT